MSLELPYVSVTGTATANGACPCWSRPTPARACAWRPRASSWPKSNAGWPTESDVVRATYNLDVFTGGNLTIMVSDMDRSVRFYTETLGLPLKFRAGNEWAEVEAPDVAIGLHPAGGHAPTGGGGGMSLGLQVSDMESAIETLKSR